MIGSAVGFANILAFSARAYLHGGSAFLIPFVGAIMVLGIPMLFLEGIVGAELSLPLVGAYNHVAGRVGKFFGWLAVLAVTTIGGFYIVLTGYSVAYTYYSAADLITNDTTSFFQHDFLGLSSHVTEFGTLSWAALLFTMLVVAFTWYVMVRNIRAGIERTCAFFLPLLFVLVFIGMGMVAFLPGAWRGFYLYLAPDLTKLLNPALWRDTFGHLFFSLSLGLGIIVGYSRYTDKKTDIRQAMWYVVFGDFVISFIAGLAIFGCIGYMSTTTGTPFHELIQSTSIFEIGFMTFPIILKSFGSIFYRLIGPLFFISLFIAGITGVFSIVESAAGNIEVEFGTTRRMAVSIALGAMSLLSIAFCFGNGLHLIGALEPMVIGNNMLIGGLAQIVVFMYGTSVIATHPIWRRTQGSYTFFYYALKYCAPIMLGLILSWNIYHGFANGFTIADGIAWGWLALAAAIASMLSYFSTTTTLKDS